MRTQAAIDCRKKLIQRFGMDQNTSFVDVAKHLIEADHLLVEADVSTRAGACAFLVCYERCGRVRPLPESAR